MSDTNKDSGLGASPAPAQAPESTDEYPDGWLDEHLARVVAELAARSEHLRPRLTGERSRVHSDPRWLSTSGD